MERETPYERLQNEVEVLSTTARHQQRETEVFVVSGCLERQVVQKEPSFIGHIVLAFIVFWCCNWLVGLIAFTLAS